MSVTALSEAIKAADDYLFVHGANPAPPVVLLRQVVNAYHALQADQRNRRRARNDN